MADVLFWLSIVSAVGMVLIPLSYKTRGRAALGWFFQWFAAGYFAYAYTSWFPEWVKPDWANGWVWAVLTWLFFIVGFIIAIRKPRKQPTPVA